MASVQERREWRGRLLRLLYDAVDGTPQVMDVDYRTLGPQARVDAPELSNAVQWLVDNGLAEWTALGGSLGITPHGVNEVEDDVEQYEPSVEVELATVEDRRLIEAFLTKLRSLEDSLDLAPGNQAALEAERTTLEVQLRSPRPNKGVLRAAVRGIAWLAQQVGGGVLGNAAFEVLKALG